MLKSMFYPSHFFGTPRPLTWSAVGVIQAVTNIILIEHPNKCSCRPWLAWDVTNSTKTDQLSDRHRWWKTSMFQGQNMFNPHLTHAQKTYLWYLAPQPSPETVPASHRVISGPPSYIAHHGFRQHLQHCVVHFAARTAPNAPAELLRARRIWRFCSGENRGYHMISRGKTVSMFSIVFF